MSKPRLTVANRIEVLRKSVSRGPARLREAVVKAFCDKSPAVRAEAALLTGENRLRNLAPRVEQLFADKSPEVRHDAAECIGVLLKNRKTAQPGVRKLLNDRNSTVRAQAIESLGLIRDKTSLSSLMSMLSDPEPFVRAYSGSTIGALGGAVHARSLRLAREKENNELALAGILEGLFLLGEKTALADMLGLLKSDDYHVRCSVANALEYMRLGKPQIKSAIAALAEARKSALARADRSTVTRVLKKLMGD